MKHALLLLELVPELEHLDLNLPLALMFQKTLIRLARLVPEGVDIVAWGVGRGVVAWPHVCQVTLHVPGGTGAARRREADIVGHCIRRGISGVELNGPGE